MSLKTYVAWIWTLVILFLCWIPRMYFTGEAKLSRPILIPNIDKFVHMGIFAIFAVLWMRASSSSRRAWWVVAAGVALAVITEIGQEVPIVNRDCNLGDGLADSVGVIAGLAGYALVRKLLSSRALPAEA